MRQILLWFWGVYRTYYFLDIALHVYIPCSLTETVNAMLKVKGLSKQYV